MMESSSLIIHRSILFHGWDGMSYHPLPTRLIRAKSLFGFRPRKNISHSGVLTLNAPRFYCHFHSTKSLVVASSRSLNNYIPFLFRLSCQGSDSLGHEEFSLSNDEPDPSLLKDEINVRAQNGFDRLEELKDSLHKAMEDLEAARLNSTMFEEKAQRISETAIALKDEATTDWHQVNITLDAIRDMVDQESLAKYAFQNATMALSLAQARLHILEESLESGVGNGILEASEDTKKKGDDVKDKEEAILAATDDIKECQLNSSSCEAQMSCLQIKKDDLQKEVDKLNELAESIQISALKAEEDVSIIMKLAEQAVAFELEATQRVNDAEFALQRAERSLSISETPEEINGQLSDEEVSLQEEILLSSNTEDVSYHDEKGSSIDGDLSAVQNTTDHANGKQSLEFSKVVETDSQKSKSIAPTKKQEPQKDMPKEGSSLNAPKASFNKSSRFFSASFFSSSPDGTKTVFASLVSSVKQQWPTI